MNAGAYDALLARCATLAVGSPALPVAYPETAFTPPTGAYLDVRVFGNAPAWEGVSQGVLGQGILQVTVVWPKGLGIINASAAADQVADHFHKGLALFSGVVRVTITAEPYAMSPNSDGPHLRIPVTIGWSASKG